jgi:hypothetical protein
VDLFGLLALAWALLYLCVRYVGATLAGHHTVQTPVSAVSDIKRPPLPQPRLGSVAIGVTAVGLAAMAVWLIRRALANRR